MTRPGLWTTWCPDCQMVFEAGTWPCPMCHRGTEQHWSEDRSFTRHQIAVLVVVGLIIAAALVLGLLHNIN